MTHRQHATIISRKTSEALKKFLGKSCPEPLHCGGGADEQYWAMYDDGCYRYFLHDLLSKPFCCALNRAIGKRSPVGIAGELFSSYYRGGMEAVEKALLEMMEAK